MFHSNMQKISSLGTIIYKFILLPFWLFVFIAVSSEYQYSENQDTFGSEFVVFGSILSLFWSRFTSIKEIKLNKDTLYISNFFSSIEIKANEIECVTNSKFFIRPEIVEIKVRNSTKFGNRIKFIPKYRYISLTEHPIVNELERLSRIYKLET